MNNPFCNCGNVLKERSEEKTCIQCKNKGCYMCISHTAFGLLCEECLETNFRKRKHNGKQKYIASQLSSDLVIKGFESEDEAWEYIERHCICQSCLDELKQGFIICGDGEDEDTFTIEHPAETACGAEWIVETEEQYIKDLKD